MKTSFEKRSIDVMDTLDLYSRRLRILVAERVRNKDRILHALQVQDQLRERSVRRVSKDRKTGVEIIREWREKRCSS